MKKELTLALLGAMVLFGGCAKNSPSISTKNVKIENLRGAHYVNGLIWQDQHINISKKVSQKYAVEYCKNLRLLDMEGWRLPSIGEATSTPLQSFKAFNYKRGKTYYHSGSRRCETVDYVNDITEVPLMAVANVLASATGSNVDFSMECQYKQYNTSVSKQMRTSPALFRCVLDPEVYKKQRVAQLQKVSASRSRHTFDGYLEAYKLSHDINDIKMAYKLASSPQEKLEAEHYFVKHMDPDKLIDVVSGNKHSSTKVKSGDALKIFSYASSGKTVTFNTRVSSQFLEHGRYKVKVAYTAELPYEITANFILPIVTGGTEKATQTVTYRLNKQNGYSDTKKVTFKTLSSLHTGMGSLKAKGMSVHAKVLEITEDR